ncbi:MAG TPA: MFS transporter [Acidimicrobiales bacterium]|jgi:MFS transporter, MHS family, proline/betaine transporter|nr:MFS transporter [Acidimicrobiales bacterium]
MSLETKMCSSSNDSLLPEEQVVPEPGMTVGSPRRAVLAGAVGNLIEFYDFAVYGVLAVTLAPLFFPSDQPGTSILSTLAVFGAAFVIKPVGGWFFGRLGDRKGRRRALVTTVVSMGVASGLMGLLPTSAAVGTLAPILLVLLRLIQGFSAGGELAGSTTYIAESAPPGKRGLFCSVSGLSANLGYSVAAAVVGLTAAFMAPAQMASWGWRIPFLISFPLALVGLWARLRLGETREFAAMVEQNEIERSPLLKTLKEYRGTLVRLFCLYIGVNGVSFIGLTYLSIYMIGYRGFDKSTVYWLTAAAIALGCCMYPFAGILVDRFGRKPMLIAGYGIFVIIAWPMFTLLNKTTSVLVAGIILFAYTVLIAVNLVPTHVVGAELFPRRVRYTGMATANNLATVVAGGAAPYVAQGLVQLTGDTKAPAWWVICVSLIALIAALTLRETRPKPSTMARDALAMASTDPPVELTVANETSNPKLAWNRE